MKDLGAKHSYESMPVEAKKDTVRYPELCIRDKSLEAAFGKQLPEVGEEMEATLKLRVKGIRNDEYGKSVDFHVVAGEFGEPEEGGEPEGEDEGEYEKA